jgi:hypothetical protein
LKGNQSIKLDKGTQYTREESLYYRGTVDRGLKEARI